MLEDVLKPIADCADLFVDDSIVGSGTEGTANEEALAAHEAVLRRVLDLLASLQLTRSAGKATIAVNEVEFAGHVVGMGHRKPIPGKIAADENWECPKTFSEMQTFLGFCNYYSGYVRMYAKMAAPITALLKDNRDETKKGTKKPIIWDDEAKDHTSLELAREAEPPEHLRTPQPEETRYPALPLPHDSCFQHDGCIKLP